MPVSELTSRAAVLKAIEEFDRLGRDAFLTTYGYGRARNWFVQYRGNIYDSKAISGVAYGHQYPDKGPLPSRMFTGGRRTSGATLAKLDFEVVSEGTDPASSLRLLEAYTWEQLGARFGFAPDYLAIAGRMVPRPRYGTLLLITHPEGGRSFDYGDYWDGDDLIYAGRGLNGDQRLDGANLDVAENRRELLLFEYAGPRHLKFRGKAKCVDYWETIAPDRRREDRRLYRFRLRVAPPTQRIQDKPQQRHAPDRIGHRTASSYLARPFNPDRAATVRTKGHSGDPDRQHVLAEQADKAHQATLRHFGLWLAENGWMDIEEVAGATDLMARRLDGHAAYRTLFEVKSITLTNERDRVRGGLAQLLEYRMFLGSQDDQLCLVTSRPISDRRLQLLDSLGIGHAYIEIGDVCVSGTRSSQTIFASSTR